MIIYRSNIIPNGRTLEIVIFISEMSKMLINTVSINIELEALNRSTGITNKNKNILEETNLSLIEYSKISHKLRDYKGRYRIQCLTDFLGIIRSIYKANEIYFYQFIQHMLWVICVK